MEIFIIMRLGSVVFNVEKKRAVLFVKSISHRGLAVGLVEKSELRKLLKDNKK